MGSGAESSGVAEPAMPMPAQGGDAGQAAEEGNVDVDDTTATRSVITTGRMSITVEDPLAAAEDAAELADGAGGRVESRNEQPGSGSQSPRADLVLRVPADELDAVVDELRGFGDVNGVTMSESDVTTERKDLDARIEALEASVDRLEQLLAQAETIPDLIAIEAELTTRQAELDSLTQQRDWLVDQVDYSTLTVELITVETAPDTAPDDFWSGLAAGWAALVGFASALGVAIGVLLPWIGVLLVLAAIVVLVVVLSTRRRRRDGAAVAPAPETPPSPTPATPEAQAPTAPASSPDDERRA